MIDVSHYNDDRTSWYEILFSVLAVINNAFFYRHNYFFFNLCVTFLSDKICCIKINYIIYCRHQTH